MAASMWRMNGLWRRMAAALLICALLLSNNVMCQDDLSPDDSTATTQPEDTTNNAVASADGVSTVNPAAASVPAGDGTAASNASGDNLGTVTTAMPNNPANQDGDTSGTPVTTPALGDIDEVVETKPTEAPLKLVVPTIKCVNEEDIKENNAVTAEVATADCEATKSVMEDNPAPWCRTDECNLSVFQEGAKMMVASENAPLADVERVLKGDILKEKLGVTSTKVPSSSGPSVFVGILVPGLLAAIAIIVGYFKFQRKSGDKGARLAEEAYPDQENQGNTLVSVAPLNPPPETVEKPSVNGESPEAAKTQPPPPTNGHSTAKTADTEL